MEKKLSSSCTSSAQTQNEHTVFVENGVYLSRLQHQGRNFRLGSVTPRFRHELSSLDANADAAAMEALHEKGLWLMPDTAAPQVAVMCGGVGSVWPGMGRALYDTFPAARAAMDRLAAVAPWDVLALMDEKDMEKLQYTRWQMPYLFFVEYAQACYLQSLGFTPHMLSGHSLGELISLCIAGVYTPEIAWQIFDRRAVYIDGLERNATDGMGMMTVYGSEEKVHALLEEFPDFYISNHNTPTQYILGGKKDQLILARKALRKEKCPALVLPINMAFHHPHLHVLRQSAVEGLMGLPTGSPTIPVLSNVTADIYPHDKEGIVEHIADLDEKTVRWVDCVRTMWDKFSVRHFVELGSADNTCGLVKDIEPRAVCMPVSLKNAEVKTMRAAVAHLYALGHIPTKGLHAVPLQSLGEDIPTTQSAQPQENVHAEMTAQPCPIASHVQDVLPILAEAAGIESSRLRPSMDIRHDLALRSNRFPVVLYAIEQQFGIRLRLEDVLHVATIQDFADVVARLRSLDVVNTSLDQEPSQAKDISLTSEQYSPLLYASLNARSALEGEPSAWRTSPWPAISELVPEQERNLLILNSAASDVAYTTLQELASLGYTFIFVENTAWPQEVQQELYLTPPSQEHQDALQALGGTCHILQNLQELVGLSLQGIVHLGISMNTSQKITTQLPKKSSALTQWVTLFDELINKDLHVQYVLALTTEDTQQKSEEFLPVLTAWEGFCHKHEISWRTIQIPALMEKGEETKSSEGIYHYELAHFFARCLLCKSAAHIRFFREECVQSRLGEDIQRFPHLFPMEIQVQPAKTSVSVSAQRNFSVYMGEFFLNQDASQQCEQLLKDMRVPQVETKHMLQTLYDAAHMSFSWLQCYGVDSLVIHPYTANVVNSGPEGVTQEGLVHVQSVPWTEEEGFFTQGCQTDITLRALSANGRRLEQWDTVMQGQVLLTSQEYALQTLWQEEMDFVLNYEGAQGRKAFAIAHSLGYNWVYELLECVQQAVLTFCDKDAEWILESIAHVRHVSEDFFVHHAKDGCVSGMLHWRAVPCEASVYMFDVQIMCERGTLLLTIEKMQFVMAV